MEYRFILGNIVLTVAVVGLCIIMCIGSYEIIKGSIKTNKIDRTEDDKQHE